MTVTVKLFAILRDKAGTGELALDLPDGATVAAAAEVLFARLPQLRPHEAAVVFAVNQAYVKSDHVLAARDELAVLPPVSGG